MNHKTKPTIIHVHSKGDQEQRHRPFHIVTGIVAVATVVAVMEMVVVMVVVVVVVVAVMVFCCLIPFYLSSLVEYSSFFS